MDKLHLELPQWFSLIAVLVGIPAATYYPFMFVRVKFWKSSIGKSMLTKGTALALIFWTALLSIPAYIYGWPWFAWWSVFVNYVLVGAVWYQILVMRKVQKSGELHERISNPGKEK